MSVLIMAEISDQRSAPLFAGPFSESSSSSSASFSSPNSTPPTSPPMSPPPIPILEINKRTQVEGPMALARMALAVALFAYCGTNLLTREPFAHYTTVETVILQYEHHRLKESAHGSVLGLY